MVVAAAGTRKSVTPRAADEAWTEEPPLPVASGFAKLVPVRTMATGVGPCTAQAFCGAAAVSALVSVGCPGVTVKPRPLEGAAPGFTTVTPKVPASQPTSDSPVSVSVLPETVGVRARAQGAEGQPSEAAARWTVGGVAPRLAAVRVRVTVCPCWAFAGVMPARMATLETAVTVRAPELRVPFTTLTLYEPAAAKV